MSPKTMPRAATVTATVAISRTAPLRPCAFLPAWGGLLPGGSSSSTCHSVTQQAYRTTGLRPSGTAQGRGPRASDIDASTRRRLPTGPRASRERRRRPRLGAHQRCSGRWPHRQLRRQRPWSRRRRAECRPHVDLVGGEAVLEQRCLAARDSCQFCSVRRVGPVRTEHEEPVEVCGHELGTRRTGKVHLSTAPTVVNPPAEPIENDGSLRVRPRWSVGNCFGVTCIFHLQASGIKP
jgi:hypothetical protein